MKYLCCNWKRYTFISESPIEVLQTNGKNVEAKENEKTSTKNDGNHGISLI